MAARGTDRDPLGCEMVLVGLAVVVGEDRVDRVPLDDLVDESDRVPIMCAATDRELAEQTVPLPAFCARESLAGLGPDALDVLPMEVPVGARGEGDRIDVVALRLLLHQGPETAELD